MSGKAQVEEPSDELAKAALRSAQCEDTFFNPAAFPNLWHTDVGDGGSDLSGGERQRLALARAIVKQPRPSALAQSSAGIFSSSKIQVCCGLQVLILQIAQSRSCLHALGSTVGIIYLCILGALGKGVEISVSKGFHWFHVRSTPSFGIKSSLYNPHMRQIWAPIPEV